MPQRARDVVNVHSSSILSRDRDREKGPRRSQSSRRGEAASISPPRAESPPDSDASDSEPERSWSDAENTFASDVAVEEALKVLKIGRSEQKQEFKPVRRPPRSQSVAAPERRQTSESDDVADASGYKRTGRLRSRSCRPRGSLEEERSPKEDRRGRGTSIKEINQGHGGRLLPDKSAMRVKRFQHVYGLTSINNTNERNRVNAWIEKQERARSRSRSKRCVSS